jgi:radical SAM superfamily enzyme YgiQ (UPF0313 family)
MDMNIARNFISRRPMRCEDIKFPNLRNNALLSQNKWDIIGVNGLIPTFGFQREIVREVRNLQPDAVIVLGGAGVSSALGEVYNEDQFGDFVAIVGEGEKAMLELVNDVSENGVPSRKVYEQDLIEDMDAELTFTHPQTGETSFVERPEPLMQSYFRFSGLSFGGPESRNSTRRIDLYTSRSCPYNCRFCYHVFGKGAYRQNSAGYAVEEILWLKNTLHPDFFCILDENFTHDRSRVAMYCELLLRHNVNVPWGCLSRTDGVDAELLALMKKSGCAYVNFGIESGSQKMLRVMGKGTKVEQNEEAIRRAREAGISYVTTFVFGFPGEDVESALETARFHERMGTYHSTHFIATPYHGTWIYDRYRDRLGDPVKLAEKMTDQNADWIGINLTEWSDPEFLGYLVMTQHAMVKDLEKAAALEAAKKHPRQHGSGFQPRNAEISIPQRSHPSLGRCHRNTEEGFPPAKSLGTRRRRRRHL